MNSVSEYRTHCINTRWNFVDKLKGENIKFIVGVNLDDDEDPSSSSSRWQIPMIHSLLIIIFLSNIPLSWMFREELVSIQLASPLRRQSERNWSVHEHLWNTINALYNFCYVTLNQFQLWIFFVNIYVENVLYELGLELWFLYLHLA